MASKFIRAALTAAAAIVVATPALAGGCNGKVVPWIWGCAPWDNNNGPQFPYYVDPKKNQITLPKEGTQTRIVNGQQQALFNGNWLQVTGTNGPNLVAKGQGNILSQNGVN